MYINNYNTLTTLISQALSSLVQNLNRLLCFSVLPSTRPSSQRSWKRRQLYCCRSTCGHSFVLRTGLRYVLPRKLRNGYGIGGRAARGGRTPASAHCSLSRIWMVANLQGLVRHTSPTHMCQKEI